MTDKNPSDSDKETRDLRSEAEALLARAEKFHAEYEELGKALARQLSETCQLIIDLAEITDRQVIKTSNVLDRFVKTDKRSIPEIQTERIKAVLHRFVTDKYLERRGLELGNDAEQQVMPLIRKLLIEDFNADFKPELNDENTTDFVDYLFDAWGMVRNDAKIICLLDVYGQLEKSDLRFAVTKAGIFRREFREYAEFQVNSIIVAADTSENLRKKAWRKGINLIEVVDGKLKLTKDPSEFS